MKTKKKVITLLSLETTGGNYKYILDTDNQLAKRVVKILQQHVEEGRIVEKIRCI